MKEELFSVKKCQFEEGFKNLANDPDMQELAEMGLGDYMNTLKEIESNITQ
jgi:hypothetical protein